MKPNGTASYMELVSYFGEDGEGYEVGVSGGENKCSE